MQPGMYFCLFLTQKHKRRRFWQLIPPEKAAGARLVAGGGTDGNDGQGVAGIESSARLGYQQLRLCAVC